MARTMSSSRTCMVIAMILAGLLLASAKRNADQIVECWTSDITVTQSSTGALQDTIPIYRVNITNAGTTAIADIHVNCGSFRSAMLVDPNIFRRLDYNDCLVNDGNPLAVGSTISFQYASSFKQPFDVSYVSCSTW